MTDLHPQKVVDKNGKLTTVHKRFDAGETASKRRLGVPRPYVPITTPEEAENANREFEESYAHDVKLYYPTASVVKLGIEDFSNITEDSLEMIDVVDVDGSSLHSEANSRDLAQIVMAAHRINLTSGMNRGTVVTNDEGGWDLLLDKAYPQDPWQ